MKRAWLFTLAALLLALLAAPSYGAGQDSIKPEASSKTGKVARKARPTRPATAFTLVKRDERVRYTPQAPKPEVKAVSAVTKETLGQVLAGVAQPQQASGSSNQVLVEGVGVPLPWVLVGFGLMLLFGWLLGRSYSPSAGLTYSMSDLSLSESTQLALVPEPVSIMGLNSWPPASHEPVNKPASKAVANVHPFSVGKHHVETATEMGPVLVPPAVPQVWDDAVQMRAVGGVPCRIDLANWQSRIPDPPQILRLVLPVAKSVEVDPEPEPTHQPHVEAAAVLPAPDVVELPVVPPGDCPEVEPMLPQPSAQEEVGEAETLAEPVHTPDPTTESQLDSQCLDAAPAAEQDQVLLVDIPLAEPEPEVVTARLQNTAHVFFGPPQPPTPDTSADLISSTGFNWPPTEEDLDTVDVLDMFAQRPQDQDKSSLVPAQ